MISDNVSEGAASRFVKIWMKAKQVDVLGNIELAPGEGLKGLACPSPSTLERTIPLGKGDIMDCAKDSRGQHGT